jgi:hypothetical protein
MHTDSTLELFSQITIAFGARIREFQAKTCPAFSTRELERERAARVRRQDKKKKATMETNCNPQKSSSGRQPKEFSLKTSKYHALGDYCNSIRRFGTTDSYSTQPVGLFLTQFSSCLITPSRVNVSIEFRKGGSFVLVAGQYRSSCQRLNSDNAASVQSARG